MRASGRSLVITTLTMSRVDRRPDLHGLQSLARLRVEPVTRAAGKRHRSPGEQLGSRGGARTGQVELGHVVRGETRCGEDGQRRRPFGPERPRACLRTGSP